MCYVCKCCGWLLDFIQRVLTFCMACVMFCSICCGISIAVMAGIAYGYNYMLAEFFTLSRSDLSVYVRRGEFYDQPDLGPNRRTGDTNEFYTSNVSDYQDVKPFDISKPLSDSWNKALNSRKYSQKLNKYSLGNLLNDSRIESTEKKPAPLRTSTFLELMPRPTREPSQATGSEELEADRPIILIMKSDQEPERRDQPKVRVRVEPMDSSKTNDLQRQFNDKGDAEEVDADRGVYTPV